VPWGWAAEGVGGEGGRVGGGTVVGSLRMVAVARRGPGWKVGGRACRQSVL